MEKFLKVKNIVSNFLKIYFPKTTILSKMEKVTIFSFLNKHP
jgi:hypothetical protein